MTPEEKQLSEWRAAANFWQQKCQSANKTISQLRKPWRSVDSMDWDYIMNAIGDGGRDRFWKTVLKEMREALEAAG